MQPVQDIVKHAIQRDVTGIPAGSFAQIGFNMLSELFFRQFCRDFAHNGTISWEEKVLIVDFLHHASIPVSCQSTPLLLSGLLLFKC
jgi:hypothetical protein